MALKRVERAIQKALIQWVKETHPQLTITTTNNEGYYTDTDQIGQLGIQDVLVFKAESGLMHVLFLELKRKKGKLSEAQKDWNVNFDARYGGCVNAFRSVAYGFTQAKAAVEWFVSGPPPGGVSDGSS